MFLCRGALITLCLTLRLTVVCQSYTDYEQRDFSELAYNPKYNLSDTDLLKKLLENYNKYLIPHYDTEHPIDVVIDIFIKAFSQFSENNMEYSISLYFRQMWRDERLQFKMFNSNDSKWNGFQNVDDLDVHPSFLEHIWQPDPTFTDFKEGKSQRLMTPSKMLRIYSNGTVWFSTLMTLVLSCHMELANYPLDVQKCNLEFESFGYRTKNIKFRWKQNPIEIHQDIKIPQFTLDRENVCTTECVRTYITGRFSCLRVTFYFYRQFGYHLLQTYLPSVLIVMLSWISFYINPDATPARVTVGITSVLTLTTQSTALYKKSNKAKQEMICDETCVTLDSGGARKELPAVSYIKAIDVWMTSCLTFVFAALLEFALVNTLREKEKKMASRGGPLQQIWMRNIGENSSRNLNQFDNGKEDMFTDDSNLGVTMPGHNQENDSNSTQFCRSCASSCLCCCNLPGRKLKARHVDHFSKALFPTFFATFNIIYWSYYISSKYAAVLSCEEMAGDGC